MSRTAFTELAVASKVSLCEDAATIEFAVPAEDAEAFSFRPGQSLTLRRIVDGRDERRSYSICSAAGTAPRVGVRVVPGGVMSRWLVDEVQPGDVVEVAPPTGSFTLDADADGHHVLVAAGSGITPLLSLAHQVLDAGGTITVLYGNRRSSTVMFADELADLKDRAPDRVRIVHVLSREPREDALGNGRIDAEHMSQLAATIPAASISGWWLCGPYDMTTDVQSTLAGLGVSADRIHRELFYVEDTAPERVATTEPITVGNCEVTTILDSRAVTASLPRDRSVLDGAQTVRADLPFACKGGVCGTCRARVVEGEVELRRNFALEDEELAAGFVLTCQSYPLTDQVTVDYDA